MEEIAVPSPPERVWAIVSNPSDVVSCIPGAELGAAHDDGSFDGVLVARFAAIRVKFAARISLKLEESEREGRLSARGRDGQGATRFSGNATFGVAEDRKTGGSRVTVNGEVNLSGKLASLVESGAGVVISRMTKEFSAQLVQRCSEPEPEPAPVPRPVTEPARAAVAEAPPRTGPLSRLRAWWARLLHRSPERGAQAGTRRTSEEAGSGNATAQ
ncbi:SRPBCC domain-containing protein [Actinoallomurus sp. CA-142502]|uniref:SRPBCC domain-containing protein n=1 Tax=Actinoallomurus sp. CA-142502 TaxID=3239885 RepID=UPI003D91C3A7